MKLILKPHVFRNLVDDLTAMAKAAANTEQLRAQIRQTLWNVIEPGHYDPSTEEAFAQLQASKVAFKQKPLVFEWEPLIPDMRGYQIVSCFGHHGRVFKSHGRWLVTVDGALDRSHDTQELAKQSVEAAIKEEVARRIERVKPLLESVILP